MSLRSATAAGDTGGVSTHQLPGVDVGPLARQHRNSLLLALTPPRGEVERLTQKTGEALAIPALVLRGLLVRFVSFNSHQTKHVHPNVYFVGNCRDDTAGKLQVLGQKRPQTFVQSSSDRLPHFGSRQPWRSTSGADLHGQLPWAGDPHLPARNNGTPAWAKAE